MSGVMMAVGTGVAGLAIAGASIYGAGEQSKAIGESTAAQTEAAKESLAFQRQVREQNLQQIQEAVDAGLISIQEGNARAEALLQPLAGLQPLEQAQQLLTQGPGELTPQQSREFGRGTEALQAGFSRVSGGGVSSRALENAQIFGQDFEARRLDQQLNRLIPFINLATGARESLANLSSGGGVQEANLRLGGASALAGVPSQGIASTMSNIGQIQGAGAIQQANVTTDLLSNLTGIGGNLLNLGIQRPQLFQRGGSTAGGGFGGGANPGLGFGSGLGG